ncbi:MAG: hypothetical protein VXX86_09080 [Planctomycetota bacterium]|nr:hypothetical protein [Planctomycetota bacterium]
MRTRTWVLLALALSAPGAASGQDCPAGMLPDCSGDGDCIFEWALGSGFCDGYDQPDGANLCCYDLGLWQYDGGDCTEAECSPSEANCGDGLCDGGEDPESCPDDCTDVVCGDGVCSELEDPTSCPADCPVCPAGSVQDCDGSDDCALEGWIGDAICDGHDQMWGFDLCCYDSDGGDCNSVECPGTALCGDGLCTGGESVDTCSEDCASCGDGLCSVGEDAGNCPADCASCGDGLCSIGEDAGNCPVDCDFCPDDPDKVYPGVCGCGIPDTDRDADGTPDCLDGCPDDPGKTAPGHCGCGTVETTIIGDVDCDGDSDAEDARVLMAQFGIAEAGACRADTNGDGVVDGMDLGAVLANWGLPCTGG